jgi:hypothetical protein
VALLVISLASGWNAAGHASLAVLGLVLMARVHERLALAPIYGAALLLVSDLARTSHELRPMDRVSTAAIRARLLTAAGSAGLGACAAAVVAVAVTEGQSRSVGISAAATMAVVAAYVGIVVLARRAGPGHEDEGVAGADAGSTSATGDQRFVPLADGDLTPRAEAQLDAGAGSDP